MYTHVLIKGFIVSKPASILKRPRFRPRSQSIWPIIWTDLLKKAERNLAVVIYGRRSNSAVPQPRPSQKLGCKRSYTSSMTSFTRATVRATNALLVQRMIFEELVYWWIVWASCCLFLFCQVFVCLGRQSVQSNTVALFISKRIFTCMLEGCIRGNTRLADSQFWMCVQGHLITVPATNLSSAGARHEPPLKISRCLSQHANNVQNTCMWMHVPINITWDTYMNL